MMKKGEKGEKGEKNDKEEEKEETEKTEHKEKNNDVDSGCYCIYASTSASREINTQPSRSSSNKYEGGDIITHH